MSHNADTKCQSQCTQMKTYENGSFAAEGDVGSQRKRKFKRRLVICVIAVLFLTTFLSLAIGTSILICNKLQCSSLHSQDSGSREVIERNTEDFIHWILNGGNKIQNTTYLNVNFKNKTLTDAWKLLHTQGCRLNNTDKRSANEYLDNIQKFVNGHTNIDILKILDEINCLENKKNDTFEGKIKNLIKHKRKSFI